MRLRPVWRYRRQRSEHRPNGPADFRSKCDRPHVLVNNAGTLQSGRSETEDGLEMTFAVNHLAPFLLNAEQGAATSVYVASSPEVDRVTGRYYRKQEFAGWPLGFNARVRAVPSSKQSYDESVAQRLWEVSEALTSVRATS